MTDPETGAKKKAAASEEQLPRQGAAPAPIPISLAAGLDVLKDQLKRLPAGPGVYRMLDRRNDVLYVGKARNLRRRVANYTQTATMPERLRRMVAETTALEIVSTHTEVEALLLEANLIKRLRPRFNILLRDDKSFPYIRITAEDREAPIDAPRQWARLMKYRGSRADDATYFGPFASAGAVNRTLNALQRAFLLRSCTDAVFSSRTRPCLLYQIKRCSAPCVGRIERDDYDRLLDEAKEFLTGRNTDIQRRFAKEMERAAEDLEFELAAYYRDRVQALTFIQARQDINLPVIDEADVIAAYREGADTCIQVFFFRSGHNYGNRAYYPRHDRNEEMSAVLSAFIGQFYDNKEPPRLLLLSHDPAEADLLGEALSTRAGRKVNLQTPRRGDKRKLVDHALANAKAALARRMAESASQRQHLDGVADAFALDATPERVEVYDNSHIQGTDAVGAMIVAGPEGFMKSAYRKFNIKSAGKDGITPGDDFGMMREVLTRRFKRAMKEDPERDRGTWPDLLLIDGGKGQLSSVLSVLADLGVEDVPVVAIAKGPDRNAGREEFHLPDGAVKSFEHNDSVLYFLQRLRDEAHRFAIGAHRQKRAQSTTRSQLDDIAGIGARRKRALLNHFGSAKEVARAGLTDLEAVEGISGTVARKIYDYFNEDG